jgi:hypothetical protein
MQTFLPYESFHLCAKALDDTRLNAQVNEAKAILTILNQGPENNYWKHTAVQMWRGYEAALHIYRNIMLSEWYDRGKNGKRQASFSPEEIIWPAWKGNPLLHASHRLMLMEKDAEHYCVAFMEIDAYRGNDEKATEDRLWELQWKGQDYYWPTKNGYDPPVDNRPSLTA